MKRKPKRARRTVGFAGLDKSRLATAGVFTGATAAALIAACPVTVTVTLIPGPHTAVLGQDDGRDDGRAPAERPVCALEEGDQATFTR